MSPASRRPSRPSPAKPWQRAGAGRYLSSDERFTVESDGSGRWFVTDVGELDELGLARTTGPFATLDAARAAADTTRDRPAEASPLAARLAEAAARPKAPPEKAKAALAAGSRASTAPKPAREATREPAPEPGREPAPEPAREPAPPPRTWLDDLMDADRDAAVRARRLIAALEREGIADADALVRRDLLGGTPAIATRLLARDVLVALAAIKDPSAVEVAQVVAGVLASSPKRGGLPGWELGERDGPGGQTRNLRLTADDLRAAAGNEAGEG